MVINNPGAIVLGSDFKALAAIRSLARAGVPTVVVDNGARGEKGIVRGGIVVVDRPDVGVGGWGHLLRHGCTSLLLVVSESEMKFKPSEPFHRQ